MKASERDDLLKLIDDKAGPVPSIISDQMAILDEVSGRMPAGADRNKLRSVLHAVVDANLKLGTSPGEELTKPGVILALRQKVLALSVDPEEPATPPTPPIVIPEMPPAGTIVKKNDRFKCPVAEASNHLRVEGPCRPSIAVADGRQAMIAWSVNPDEYVEGQASGFGNGGGFVSVPAGVFYLNWKGVGAPMQGDISVY